MNIEPRFERGQIVTLKAMLGVPEHLGLPQRLAVVYLRVDWDFLEAATLRYYCQALCNRSREASQAFHTGERLINGLALVDEADLVPYPIDEVTEETSD